MPLSPEILEKITKSAESKVSSALFGRAPDLEALCRPVVMAGQINPLLEHEELCEEYAEKISAKIIQLPGGYAGMSLKFAVMILAAHDAIQPLIEELRRLNASVQTVASTSQADLSTERESPSGCFFNKGISKDERRKASADTLAALKRAEEEIAQGGFVRITRGPGRS